MPIPGNTPRARRTKAAILRAAEQVFGAKGFERASITDITQSAGVAQGTFYLHFADKKAVFLALVAELGREMRQALRAATEGHKGRLAIERAGFAAFFTFVRERGDLYRIMRQAQFVDEEAYRAHYLGLAKSYSRALAKAMSSGELRALDPERLAWALMGIADFLGMRFVLWEDANAIDIESLTDEAMELLETGMAPRSAPRRGRGVTR